jgi:hypothetical protein
VPEVYDLRFDHRLQLIRTDCENAKKPGARPGFFIT